MKFGKTLEFKEHECLSCGKKMDRIVSVGEEAKSANPGDLAICLGCGHLMAFDDSLNPRNPTSEELAYIAGDKRLLTASRVIKMMRGMKEYETT